MSMPSARRPASILAVYLALTAIPAALGAQPGGTRARAVLLVHAALLTFLVMTLRLRDDDMSPTRRWLLALTPLAAIPFLYGELPTLMSGLREGYLDAVVQPWEYALFGGDTPARTLAPTLFTRLGAGLGSPMSEIFYASYLSYYLIIYVPPLLLLVRRQLAVYVLTLTGMMLAFLSCFIVFVVFPVEGPRYIWPAPDAAMQGPIRMFTLQLVELGSSRGAEFPSSHVAVAMAQSIMALRWQRRLGMVMFIATLLLSVAVVFAGFHYAVDVIAGAAVGAAIGIAIVHRQRIP